MHYILYIKLSVLNLISMEIRGIFYCHNILDVTIHSDHSSALNIIFANKKLIMTIVKVVVTRPSTVPSADK